MAIQPEDEALLVVPFVPFRCPYCERHKPRTYAVRGRVRFHRCQACGRKYKSLELTRAAVRDFTSDPQSGGDH